MMMYWLSQRALANLCMLLCALSLVACAGQTPYQRPAVELPAQWQAKNETTSAGLDVPDQWWRTFGNDELNRLVDSALANNQELSAAQHRVAQARALVDLNRSAAAPRLDARGEVSRTHRSSQGIETVNEIGVAASWDLDLGGANARAVDAAAGRVQQRRYARESLGAALLVELCDQYFRALSASDRLELARANIANAASLLDLLSSRQQAGALANLEVLRQQGLIASLRASLAPLEQQRQSARTAMAVLMGRAPQGFDIRADSLAVVRLPSLPAALPVQLLERHPDVRQAETEVIVANADLNAQRAAWVPKLSLGAGAGLEAVTLRGLFNGATVLGSAGASLLAPILDGGRIRAQLGAASARQDEVTSLYRQAVLNALRDVEDRLSALNSLAEQTTQQQRVVDYAQSALKMADLRFRNGATDYATVLDAQRVLLAAQDAQALIQLARYSQTLGLVRALGGGAPASPAPAARVLTSSTSG